MRWIRLNIDFDNTAWLFGLSPAAQMAWIKLICHVKRDGVRGRCKALDPRIAAARFAIPVPDVEAMLRAAIDDHALTIEDGFWTLTGWTEYQEVDNRVADRVRRHRARQSEELPFEEGSAEFPPRPPVQEASAPPPPQTDQSPKRGEAAEAAGCIVPAPHTDQPPTNIPNVGRGCPSLATSTHQPPKPGKTPEAAGCVVPAPHAANPLPDQIQRKGRDASCPASHTDQPPQPGKTPESAGCVVPAPPADHPPCNGVTTVTPPVTRHATETGTKTETQTDSFGTFWAAYPPRAGDRKRNAAEILFRKLIRQKIPAETLVEGARRYRAYCEAAGKTGTEYVQQATTWLNNRAWENDFRPAQDLPKHPVKDVDFWEDDPTTVHVDFQGRVVDAQDPRRYGTAIRRRLFWIRQGKRTEEPFSDEAWREQRSLR